MFVCLFLLFLLALGGGLIHSRRQRRKEDQRIEQRMKHEVLKRQMSGGSWDTAELIERVYGKTR